MAGIRIGVHWSLLVIVLALVLALADHLPDAHPGRPPWQYGLTGLLGTTAFLLSLLAHESVTPSWPAATGYVSTTSPCGFWAASPT
ncbi:hypothetical protein [Streptomyces nigra]|uniref:hypothetical protein n=1 Tax=Streptomyces nigra TaxID=1827580 RepID=UPI0035D93FB4